MSLLESLTKREIQVLDCLTRGMDRPQLAETLDISPLTVKSHIARIGEALGTGDHSMQVALYAWLSPNPIDVPDEKLQAYYECTAAKRWGMRGPVLNAVCGLTNSEIARLLNLTTHTIKTHLGRAYSRLGIGDRRELAVIAMAAVRRDAGQVGFRLDLEKISLSQYRTLEPPATEAVKRVAQGQADVTELRGISLPGLRVQHLPAIAAAAAVAAGEPYLPLGREHNQYDLQQQLRFVVLRSPQDQEIAHRMAAGQSNEAIEGAMGLAVGDAQQSIKATLEELCLTSWSELARMVVREVQFKTQPV